MVRLGRFLGASPCDLVPRDRNGTGPKGYYTPGALIGGVVPKQVGASPFRFGVWTYVNTTVALTDAGQNN